MLNGCATFATPSGTAESWVWVLTVRTVPNDVVTNHEPITPREAEEMAAHHCSACMEIDQWRQRHIILTARLRWTLQYIVLERAALWADILNVHCHDAQVASLLVTDTTYQQALAWRKELA